MRLPTIIVITPLVLLCASGAWASGWNRGVNVTSIGVLNLNGEVAEFTIAEPIDNSAHCANPTGYAVRDPLTFRSLLALLTSAFMTQKPVDVLVSGTCDASGMPNVTAAVIRDSSNPPR
jgi:hypothetical protein